MVFLKTLLDIEGQLFSSVCTQRPSVVSVLYRNSLSLPGTLLSLGSSLSPGNNSRRKHKIKSPLFIRSKANRHEGLTELKTRTQETGTETTATVDRHRGPPRTNLNPKTHNSVTNRKTNLLSLSTSAG